MPTLSNIGPVLITGAGGFIGAHAVRDLAEAGAEVVATTRDGRRGTRVLDVCDADRLPAALAGVGAVVHCAVGGREVTVDGTARLLRAAAAAGVRRVVHLSSMSVYGGATGRVAETTPTVSPEANDYGGWKAAAEAACLAEAGAPSIRLRPTIVYGPGVDGAAGGYWLDSMVRRVASGRWATLGAAGEGTCNLVHVGDVTGAIAAALLAPAAADGAVFNVNGPETTTWNGYFIALAAAMGAPKLPARSAAGLQALMLAALPIKILARLRPGLAQGWLSGVPGRGELGLFALQATYLTDAARAALGWSPQTHIVDGLARSLA